MDISKVQQLDIQCICGSNTHGMFWCETVGTGEDKHDEASCTVCGRVRYGNAPELEKIIAKAALRPSAKKYFQRY